jgi:endonuclease/exonuclease/phosphatase family metal-dependent hydrolase
MRLSLATYNIHSCVGSDGRYDPDRIIDVLSELGADVIGLQEVDSEEHRGLDLLDYVAEQTGLRPIPGRILLKTSGHYGNALLTRVPARDVRRVDLSVAGSEPRGAIDVDLECGGHTMQIVVTHLGLRPAERRFQIERLVDCFHGKHGALMGDLNEWFLWGPPLRRLGALFGEAPHLRTFPARFPIFPLDRIWVRPAEALISLAAHRTPLSRIASDHLPVKAVISF